MLRYWWHPESECLFTTNPGEPAPSEFGGDAGLVEELTLEQYNAIENKLKEQAMSNGPTAGTYIVRKWSDPTGQDPDPAAIDLSRLVNEWLEKNGPDGMFRTCANCRHMEKVGSVMCALYSAVPPTPVFLRGCDKHVDVTEIPF